MTRRDKFFTEMIVNVDYQHRGIFVIIFFWTFHLLTPLTNASPKDENTKFSLRKYKKCDKYIRTLIIDCIGEKLGKKELKKNSKIQLKI